MMPIVKCLKCPIRIGVEPVRLAVYDLERELYWNGQQWQPNFFLLQAELENPGGQITFWKL